MTPWKLKTILEKEAYIGFILCLTDNRDLNILIAEKWLKVPDIRQIYSWDGSNDNQEKNNHSKIKKIWDFLPKPSIISSEIKNGEALLIENTIENKEQFKDGRELLLEQIGDSIVFNKKSDSSNINLAIKREKILLLQIIEKQNIFFIDTTDQKRLYEIAAKKLSDKYPTLSYKKLSQYLLEREINHPTGIGNGIALPHAYNKNLTFPICSIIKLKKGIDWKAYDKTAVRLIFLLISPTGDPDRHLSLLSQISHLVGRESARENLIHCKKAEEVLKIIKREMNILEE